MICTIYLYNYLTDNQEQYNLYKKTARLKTRNFMKYKTITYKRIRNLGNYQSSALEITIELDESDNIDTSIDNLKSLVKDKLFEKTKSLSTSEEIPFSESDF